MEKAYQKINWENYPSEKSPINESNLNKMDNALDVLDNRIIKQDTEKAGKTEIATLVSDVKFEESTGIITVIKKNGSKLTIDTKMEKIAVNFSFDKATQNIILTLIDGTKQYINLSAFITQYEFLDSDTVAFSIDADGKVSAIVVEGSIQEKHLRPDYLADIKSEASKAQAGSKEAAKSAADAKNSAGASEQAKKDAQSLVNEIQKKLDAGELVGPAGPSGTADTSFTEPKELTLVVSGEDFKIILGKIGKAVRELVSLKETVSEISSISDVEIDEALSGGTTT